MGVHSSQNWNEGERWSLKSLRCSCVFLPLAPCTATGRKLSVWPALVLILWGRGWVPDTAPRSTACRKGHSRICCMPQACSDSDSALCYSKNIPRIAPNDLVKSPWKPRRATSCSSVESMWAAWQSQAFFPNHFSSLLKTLSSHFSSWCFCTPGGWPQRCQSIQGLSVLFRVLAPTIVRLNKSVCG